MIRDSIVFRSIPFVTTGLAFLPACGGDDGNVTASDDDSTGDPTMTVSATDPSADDDDDDDSGTSSVDDATATIDDSGSSDGGSSSDSGDPVCGEGSCNAVAPVGWFGPVTYARVEPGGNMPACPGDILQPGPTVLDGFEDPGPATCTCECELSAPLTCNSCAETSATQNCQGGGYYYGGCPYNATVVTENCTNIDILGFLSFTSTDQGYYGMPQPMCEEESEELIPPFQFDATIVTCKVPDTALVCADGICVPPAPEGFEAKWCIYQTGDLECTDPSFPNKSIFYSNVEDTRGCTSCQCGSAASSCEEQQLMVFDGEDCAGEPIAVLDATGACVAGTGGSVAGTGTEAACPVTEAPVPEGAIMPTGPFTFCCDA